MIKQKQEIKDGSEIASGGIYTKNTSQTDTYTIQNTIEFNRVFKDDHVVNLMAVSEIRQVKTDGFGPVLIMVGCQSEEKHLILQ